MRELPNKELKRTRSATARAARPSPLNSVLDTREPGRGTAGPDCVPVSVTEAEASLTRVSRQARRVWLRRAVRECLS